MRYHFYPRSPCGERQSSGAGIGKQIEFLSTLSLRRATIHYDNYNLHCVISIHALLAESDPTRTPTGCACMYFYPRSPCGERHLRVLDGSKSSIISIHALLAESDCFFCVKLRLPLIFLSTLSLRRATPSGLLHSLGGVISIHALLAESDRSQLWKAGQTAISIHALLAESDSTSL